MAREAIWLIVGHALSALGGLVAIRVVTRIYPSDIYGTSWLLINGVGLAVMLLANPFGEAVNRFYHDCRSERELNGLLRTVFRLQVIISAGAALLYWSASSVFGWIGGPDWLAFTILPVYFALLGFSGTAQLLLNTARRRNGRVVLAVTEAWLKPAGAVVCAFVWGPSVTSLVVGYASASILTGMLGLYLIRDFAGGGDAATRVEPTVTLANIGAYSLPLVGFAAAGWVLALGDRYLVNLFLGATITGVYVAAYQVGAALFQFLGGVFGPLAQPIIFGRAEGQTAGGEAVTDSVRVFAWLSLPLLAGFVVAHGWLVRWLTAPEYWNGASAALVVGIGVYLSALGDRFMQLFLAARRTRPVMAIRSAAAVSNVLLNLLLIPRLGMVGAALSTAAAYALYALFMWFWSQRMVAWRFPANTFLAASLAAGAASGAGLAVHRVMLDSAYDVRSAAAVFSAFAIALGVSGWAVRAKISSDFAMVLGRL